VRARDIESRAVSKIVLVALFIAALAVLGAIVLLHTTTTLRWVVTAIFLALALDPAVRVLQRIHLRGRPLPRALAILAVYLLFFAGLFFLVLHVLPPIIRDIEGLAKKLPTYVSDFEHWAENNAKFAELNQKYDLTAKLSDQAGSLPSKLGDGAGELGSVTVQVLEHVIAFVTVITLTFFLLLDGGGMFRRGTERLDAPHRERARRIGVRVAAVVRSYVSVNCVLALFAGLLTFAFLEIGGFHMALPLAVLVAFLDLIPLIGLTLGGVIVFAALMIDGGPGDALIWLALFLVYQQLQDRVIQPVMYRGGALKVNPAVAIVAVIVGANLAGVLGALLAIPTAASLGVLVDELMLSGPPVAPASGAAGGDPQPEP
jgi:predicted PurR-regulated permease PerM